MSEYVRWLNLIKLQATEEWLTTSQAAVVSELERAWRTEKCVALRGDSGSGKSFIGRLLSQRQNGIYTSSIDGLVRAEFGDKNVVLDLGPEGEYSRAMRLIVESAGARHLVVLTRHLPRDLVCVVDLQLTPHDVQQVRHTLSTKGIIEGFSTEPSGVDLSEDLRLEALARSMGTA